MTSYGNALLASTSPPQLRKTFEVEIARLEMEICPKPNRTLLEHANAMIKGGLDVEFSFGPLLMLICLVYARLGKPRFIVCVMRNSVGQSRN